MVFGRTGSPGHGAHCGAGGGDAGWVRPLYVQRHASIGCLAGNEPDPAPFWRDLSKPGASVPAVSVTGGAGARGPCNHSCGLMPICCISLVVESTSRLK